MESDNQITAPSASLRDFIGSQAGRELLASADAAFARIDFSPAASFLTGKLAAMPDIEDADDLALGELLDQLMALRSSAASLNGFAVEFCRQSGRLALAVAAIKTFTRYPTSANRARLQEAAAPLDGFHVRMPPRMRRLLRPFIKGYFSRRELLSYGKLYLAVSDHVRDGVIAG